MRATLLVACFVVAIACGKDEPRLAIDVQGSSFERSPIAGTGFRMATIPFDIKNEGDATAFVASCNGRISATVEQRVDSRWVQYAAEICLATQMSTPVELRAGARSHGDVGVGESGQYRVRVFYAPGQGADRQSSSASRAFDVR